VIGLIVAIMVILGLGAYVYFAYIRIPAYSGIGGGGGTVVNLTKENFVAIMSENTFVKQMPDEAIISLSLGEEYYTISNTGVVKSQTTGYDFELSVPDTYLPLMANLCNAVAEAKKNGELGFDTALSNSELMWKYKSMLKYRDCFGF